MSISPTALSVSCALCGADCEAEARFCPHCGAPISHAHKGDDALTGVGLLEFGVRIDERASCDAIARVFRGSLEGTQDAVAVRVIHDHLARNRRFRAGFEQAATQASRLDHPGIVRVAAFGTTTHDERAVMFLVTELFEGRHLQSIVQARGLLPLAQVLLITAEMLEALEGAHRLGVVHGDLKPENVVIGATADGQVRAKVADFLIARLASVVLPRLGTYGTALGTACYQAPEVVRGGAPTARSDVYAMGAILYEQLTGHRAFDGASSLAVEAAILRGAPIAPRAAAPWRGIGEGLEAIVLRALATSPQDRFESAESMRAAILEARAEEAQSDSASSPDGPPSGRPGRPRRLVARAEFVDVMNQVGLAPVAYGVADQGHPRGAVAIVLGGAGMGKTALIDDLFERLRGGPLAVFRVDGRRALCRPLEPFTALVSEVLGVSRNADPATVTSITQSLRTRFRLDEEEIVRLLDRVMARPSSLSVTPDAAEREQVRSLRTFVGRLFAMRPSLLIIEDADSMDVASLRLALDLMEATATLAMSVVVSGRGDPWPDWNAPHVSRVYVPNLDDQGATSLLRARIAGAEVPPEALSLAKQWAKGSPLLLELCARAILRREILLEKDGVGRPPSSSQDLFGGLRELVSTALRGTPPVARRWLSCAAISGPHTPVAILAARVPPETSREETLQACRATGLVHLDGNDLVFDNEGVRDVVRAMTPDGEIRDTHRFIARWYLETDPPRAPLEVIAGHLEAAGEAAEAASLLERDGLDLLQREEPLAAAALFGRAARVWQSIGDKAAVQRAGMLQAEAQLNSGDGKSAGDTLTRLERFGPLAAEGLRARVFASVATAQGDRELALKALQRASDIAVNSLDQDAWYEVEFHLAEVLYNLGRLEEAEKHAALAHELSRSIADSHSEVVRLVDGSRVAQASSFVSKIRLALGRPDGARAILQESLEHAAVLGDEASASRMLANLAHVCAHAGQAEAALGYAERAFTLARRAGDRMAAARIALNLGAYQTRQGQQDRALETFRAAKTFARAVGWARGVRLARQAVAQLDKDREAP